MRLPRLRPLVLGCVLSVSVLAHADEKSDLEKGRNAYVTKQYVEADARFSAMLNPATGTLKSPEVINEARMIWGAVYMAMKRTTDAEALFERVIRQDNQYQPDPLTFPTEVLDKFTDVRARLQDEINAQKQREAQEAAAKKAREEAEKLRQQERLKVLEQLARTETVTEVHSRWVALAPFGVGQFQNGKRRLGTFFAVTEAVLAVASGVAFGVYQAQVAARSDYDSTHPYSFSYTPVHNQYVARETAAFVVTDSIGGAFALLAIVGIVEAQVGFVPEKATTRLRTLPSARLVPLLSPAGGGLSLTAHF